MNSRIITCVYALEDSDNEFDNVKKLKRLKKRKWIFLVSGEYSPSMFHQGNIRFYYTTSLNDKNIYILGSGFPEKIYSIYQNINIDKFNLNKEEFLGQMLKELMDNNGPYIEFVHDSNEDINLDKLFRRN